jgi:hypothetical protein
MLSFLYDAQEFLPTTAKPSYSDRSWSKRQSVKWRKAYKAIVASARKRSIWDVWLRALELPDHEDLWDE